MNRGKSGRPADVGQPQKSLEQDIDDLITSRIAQSRGSIDDLVFRSTDPATMKALVAQRARTRAHELLELVHAEFPGRRVSFQEAARELWGHFINLEYAWEVTRVSHSRYGLIDACVQAGIVDNADEYAERLRSATLSLQDLREVCRRREIGEKFDIVFDPGLGTQETFDAVMADFSQSSIPRYTIPNANGIRKIDPSQLPADLFTVSKKSQRNKLLKEHLAGAPAVPAVTQPRILFVPVLPHSKVRIDPCPLIKSTRMTGDQFHRSNLDCLQDGPKTGTAFMDPSTDFIYFRMILDQKTGEMQGWKRYYRLGTKSYIQATKVALTHGMIQYGTDYPLHMSPEGKALHFSASSPFMKEEELGYVLLTACGVDNYGSKKEVFG